MANMPAVPPKRAAAAPAVRRVPVPEPLTLDAVRDWAPEDLMTRGTKLAQAYAATEKISTTILKSLAAVLIARRLQMGDLAGQSHAYKVEAQQMYLSANIPDGVASNLRASVRYHINNLLRTVASPEELEDAGLSPKPATERAADRRRLERGVVHAATALHEIAPAAPATSKRAAKAALPAPAPEPQSPVRAVSDHLRIAQMLESAIGRMQPAVIEGDMTPDQRRVLYTRLQAVKREITALSSVLRDAGMR
ncbi:hypothetical protein ACFV1L_10320 [Kitasatospora sp. NPDC059646]|uniref:hypothetical protein n=1 Tax=Kitasatospora sp. NPDC059646 TaxID=3346893 RepID=UPI0036C29E6A